ncbi:MAG: tagatose 1,6-diphosphate aldolase [Phototrophicaceae bacterium]
MSEIITPGRWRGLQTTSTDNGRFSILAFDQRGSYVKMLPDGTSFGAAVQIKREVVGVLSRYASAVLLDADYGFIPAAYMSSGSGLLLSVEKSGYSGDSTYRKTEFFDTWNVAKIKRSGASAVKLMIYYHPDSGELAEELEALTARVIAECREYDIPMFLEPMSYSLDANIRKESAEFAATKPAVVRDTARRLSALGPDVLKLEFPFDANYETDFEKWQVGCAAISEVCSVPWVLLIAGVDFETFETQTRAACMAGASGFLAGRAIWKECVTMTPEERARFLETTASERIQKLIDVIDEHARPWTDFYMPMALGDHWYDEYTAI